MPTLTNMRDMQELLAKHGFRFSKALGQNFLINPSVCPRMASLCGADDRTGVLEIGPGIGVLTEQLAAVARKVVSVELDDRLLPVLAETLAGHDNVEIVHGDILKLDLPKLIEEKFSYVDENGKRQRMPVVVCANLPYYITSPVLMALMEQHLPIDAITVLVQKEAAERLCAAPGTRECGAITLAVHYYAEPEILFGVSRGSFMPAPNVDSTVIRLTMRRDTRLPADTEKQLFRVIRAAFEQRRKTLNNSLKTGGFSKEQIAAALEAADIPPTARAEQLTMEQFVRLASAL